MSFKNAFKNLIAHFSTVWALLLYIIAFAALIAGISMPFIFPIGRELTVAGVFDDIGSAFTALFKAGDFNGLWNGFASAYNAAVNAFKTNETLASISMAFIIAIVLFAFRFFLGLYEIPMATVVDGRLSCNAHYGFSGKFFSTLPAAAMYSLFKMLFTLLYDSVLGLIIYGLSVAIGMSIVLPFVIILVLLVLGSLRFSIVACWAPCVAAGDSGVIKGFARSAKLCFKNFGTIYSTYFVSLMLMFAVSAFVTIFTLGVGLFVVLPCCAVYVCYLNATEYYNKSGRRYYVDGAVFTPPEADKSEEKNSEE